jgi:hypothetical protein
MRIGSKELERWCNDCWGQGTKIKGELMADISRPGEGTPTETMRVNFGVEIASYPILILCNDHKKRRRNLFGEEWMTIKDAKKFMENRKINISTDANELTVFQQRAMKLYGDKE